jgi:hypothetical protein
LESRRGRGSTQKPRTPPTWAHSRPCGGSSHVPGGWLAARLVQGTSGKAHLHLPTHHPVASTVVNTCNRLPCGCASGDRVGYLGCVNQQHSTRAEIIPGPRSVWCDVLIQLTACTGAMHCCWQCTSTSSTPPHLAQRCRRPCSCCSRGRGPREHRWAGQTPADTPVAEA